MGFRLVGWFISKKFLVEKRMDIILKHKKDQGVQKLSIFGDDNNNNDDDADTIRG